MKHLSVLTILIFVLALTPTTLGNGESIMGKALNTLASIQFAGRRPGTNGNVLATDYIVSMLKKFGVPEIQQFPGYKQEFTIFTEMEKYGENLFSLTNQQTAALFEPISFSLSGTVENASLVFAGFGISIPDNDPKLTYDDYAGLDVENKIVVVMTGDPAVGNPQSLFRDAEYFSYRSVHYKMNNALAHGAKGILFVQDPLSLNNPAVAPAPYFNAQEGGGNRLSIVAGSIQHTWLDLALKKYGTSTLKQQQLISSRQVPASFPLEQETATLKVHLKKKTGRVSNVVAFLPGQSETLKKEVIVLGAHFDHLGLGGASSLEPDPKPQIHYGADDNASGTSVALELLHDLMKRPRKRSLAIVFFNAEEQGLLGSKHFVSSWSRLEQDLGTMKAMLNFDMVGRFDKKLTVMGVGSAFEWEQELLTVQKNMRDQALSAELLPMTLQKDAVGSSDHSSFITQKIPALFFTTGAHEDYHRASDTSDKIKFREMGKLKTYALHLTDLLLEGTVLNFNEDILTDDGDSNNRGYGAHLGCVPEFGQDPSIIGVLCTRASANSPALAAGIVGGDILKAIGDIDIKSIYDLAFALRYYRAGDEVLLKWYRPEIGMIERLVTLKTRN